MKPMPKKHFKGNREGAMEYHFAFRHVNHSDALESYAFDKLDAKFAKFVRKPVDAHVTFSSDGLDKTVHCDLFAGDGFRLAATDKAKNHYAAVDRLADKLGRQLKRQKAQIQNHHKNALGHHNWVG